MEVVFFTTGCAYDREGDQIHNNKMYKTQKTKTRACFFFFLQHRRGGGWRSVGGVLERTKKKKNKEISCE